MTTIQSTNEEQWHAVRSEGIGASEIAAALGCSRYMTPRQLWARKVGLPVDEMPVHDRMRWGTALEPVAAAWLENEWRVAVQRPEPFTVDVHPVHEWMRATLDGRMTVTDEATCDAPRGEYVVDFKLIHPFDDAWRGDQCPDDYAAQIGQQMLVKGVPRGLLVAVPFADRVDMREATVADWEKLTALVRQLAATLPPEQVLATLGCGQPFVRVFAADPRVDATLITRGGEFWIGVLESRRIFEAHGRAITDESVAALRAFEPVAQAGDLGDMRAQYREPRAEALDVEPQFADELRAAKENATSSEKVYADVKARAIQALGNLSAIQCRGRLVATYKVGAGGRRTFLVK